MVHAAGPTHRRLTFCRLSNNSRILEAAASVTSTATLRDRGARAASFKASAKHSKLVLIGACLPEVSSPP